MLEISGSVEKSGQTLSEINFRLQKFQVILIWNVVPDMNIFYTATTLTAF